MPIIDYEKSAEASFKAILEDPKISDVNKAHAERFDKVYKRNVRPATRNKFWRHMPFFLRETNDCTELFEDRDAVNDLFERLHRELSSGYYITIINCTNRFVRWLNDDMKPKAFKDIKSPKKSLQRRKLSKNDMWEWEEALKVIGETNSVQVKAMVMTQLNLGARPSEFIDLRYGDIEAKGDFMIINIRDGKTGERKALLYHAVPYLARWMNDHPTKDKNDPLWILEDSKKSHRKGDKESAKGKVISARYPAIRKRIEVLKARANIDKGSDFYTFRHSCARLLRLWGVPVEECAKQLGHSVKEFTETYGRLDTSDRELRHAKAFGIEVEDSVSAPKPQSCAKCGSLNGAESEFCGRCGSALSVKTALGQMAEQDAAIEEFLMSKLEEIAAKKGLQVRK